jgi:hypothetical protein
VIDAAESPMITGMVAARAAELAAETWGTNFNLMINSGTAADQTLFHLHVHIWPRRRGDNLGGPWTAQQQTASAVGAGQERRPRSLGAAAEPHPQGSAGADGETPLGDMGEAGSLGPQQTPAGAVHPPRPAPAGLHEVARR